MTGRHDGALTRIVALAVVLALAAAPVVGQDSTRLRPLPPRSPVTLARVGTYAGLLTASAFADHGLRSLVQSNRGSVGDNVASVGNLFGEPRLVLPVLGGALLVSKVAGAEGLARTAFHSTVAVVVAGTATQVIKFGVGRARPGNSGNETHVFQPFTRSDEFNSFPSGHTAVAFALATALAQDVPGKWAHRLFYAGAATTAFARINKDKHWLSDVVAGALLGHFTARMFTREGARVAPIPGGVGVAIDF